MPGDVAGPRVDLVTVVLGGWAAAPRGPGVSLLPGGVAAAAPADRVAPTGAHSPARASAPGLSSESRLSPSHPVCVRASPRRVPVAGAPPPSVLLCASPRGGGGLGVPSLPPERPSGRSLLLLALRRWPRGALCSVRAASVNESWHRACEPRAWGGRLNSEPPRPTLLGGSEREPLAPPDRCPVGLLSHLEILGPMLVERMRVLSAPSGDVRSSPRSGGQRSGRSACESAACGAALSRPVPAGGVPSVTRVPRRSVTRALLAAAGRSSPGPAG